MKKLFISCPMRGRTEENIRSGMERLHKIAEAYFDQELEVIPTYISGKAPDNTNSRIWYLGESIKMMAEADYFIGVDSTYQVFPGCDIEHDVAKYYNIPNTLVGIEMMPDAAEIADAHWGNS